MVGTIRDKLWLIWQDIRQFRNLELYLILFAIVALFIFEIFGAPSESALTEALLAGIAVLIYGQLDARHKEQKVADKLDSLTKQITALREQQGYYVQVYPHGRSAHFDFTAFMEKAQTEVIIIGISLTAFTQCFTEMPAKDFKDRVVSLVAKGVKIRCLLLDPKSDIGLHYASDRKESDIQERIAKSKTLLSAVSAELSQANWTGNIEVYTYPHLPYCYLALVDPNDDNGMAIVSHYLYETKRAETPIFHLDKVTNPILFEKYYAMALSLLKDSTPVAKHKSN